MVYFLCFFHERKMNFGRQYHVLIVVIVDFTVEGKSVFILYGCFSALVSLSFFLAISFEI